VGGLRALLEQRVGRLWVVGEVSNLRRAGSGHLYFTLKDERAQIRAALFRGAARRLAFEPQDGLEVLVYAEVTLYAERGDLQLVVRHLEPRGAGALQVAFEQLRRRLEAEGLFAAERKRRPAALPRRIGVVASAASAALRDVLEVTGRRCPGLPLLVAPARVQGAGAEHEIAAALGAVARAPGVDVVLLVRGGGSLEDLAPFNSELLARAICASPVPVVAGVGHEVDVTIADLAADLRAPTPSAAAELVAPERAALRAALAKDWGRLRRAAAALLGRREARLAQERGALALLAPARRLAAWRARLPALARALAHGARACLAPRARVEAHAAGLAAAARARLARAQAELAAAAARLEALSPLAVLARGYGLVRRARDGAIVRRAGDLERGERLLVRVAEAELEALVEAVRELRRS
jgi:exodeoxyribonuclease VII large subunit